MRNLIVLFAIAAVIATGCKKGDKQKEESLAKKYAKFQVLVYKDKNLKERLAVLSKAESVDLLGEEKFINEKKMQVELSNIKLSDDSTGYTLSSNLADKPIVFTEDTKVHDRNNIGSRVSATVPKGTIAFIIEEKGGWVKIYAGKIGDQWIADKWAKGGFNSDENLILDAKTFEEASTALKKGSEGKKEYDEALNKLKELSKSSTLFGNLAREKLDEIEGKKSQQSDEKQQDKQVPEENPGN